MNRVHLRTFGCQMNERDSEAIAAQLRERGYLLAASEEEADILLVNTCSVRDLAEQKALSKMGQLAQRKRRQPHLVIGFLGCMAQNRGRELLDRLPDLDLVVGTQRFHHLAEHLEAVRRARSGGVLSAAGLVDIAEEEGSQNAVREHAPDAGRVTAFVSIQQGCDMRCSFCIVPRTRGDERSRPPEEIVAECRGLAEQGVREVTLLGQIVTSYGRGEFAAEGGRGPFVRLLEAVAAVPGIERVRFTSPHPCGFKDDLVEAYRRLPQLMPHCHLPLQSGSDRVLRAMNRPYTRDLYWRVIEKLRAARPEVHFSTDVIVGFPGETAEDFDQTLELFERVGYDMAYIFKYSARSGTPAAEMEDQVGEVEKELRNQRLLALLEASSRRRVSGMVGGVQEVLLEGRSRMPRSSAPGEPQRCMGRTPGNRVVHVSAPPGLIGKLVPVRVERATPSALYGELAGPPR